MLYDAKDIITLQGKERKMWKLVKFLLVEGGILIFECRICGSFVW